MYVVTMYANTLPEDCSESKSKYWHQTTNNDQHSHKGTVSLSRNFSLLFLSDYYITVEIINVQTSFALACNSMYLCNSKILPYFP